MSNGSGEIDPPWRLDPLQNIVNVHWGGLAAEFLDGDNYLSYSAGVDDFSEAVISLWFRVPQESIDAAAAAYKSDSSLPFNGIIPLVVMGKKGNTAGGDSLDPTYIGLVCGLGPEDKNTAGLFANFETCAEPDINIDHLKEGSSTASISTHAAITADSWHHMLVSVKLDDMSSTGWAFDDEDIAGGDITGHFGGLSHVYMAIDDVNLLGSDLTGDYPEGYDDKNAVAASDCIEIANEIQPSEVPPGSPLGTPAEPTGPVPSYSVSSLTVPGGGNPIGLPATSEFASSILRVEMAEFQMWTGVSMDTSDETFRRAFIDADGKPVPPDRKRGDGESSGSIELMGSRPNVLFNGSGNWINGKNTGPPPDATPSGPPPVGPPPPGSFDFTPTGTIKAYKPDPSLHGPQS